MRQIGFTTPISESGQAATQMCGVGRPPHNSVSMTRPLIIGCVAAISLSACATHQGRNELPSYSPRAKDIQKSLDQTVISKVDVEGVSLDDALKAWHNASQASHATRFDFRYTISHPMTFISRPTSQAAPAAAPATPPKITVRRKNITSARLLDEICRQSNCTWVIMGRVVVIQPRAAAAVARP